MIKEAFTKPFARHREPPDLSASRRANGEQAVWQRRFWEHVIRNEADYAAHVDYIHHNPVRHGIVSAVRDWPHSSFSAWVERGVYEPYWGSAEMPPMPEWVVRGE